jgi:hypothetical protein
VAERLWVPFRLLERQKGEVRSGPEFIVPITYSEVAGRPPTAADLWGALTVGDRIRTTITIATVINAVERFSQDATLQRALADTFLRPEYRKAPEAKPDERLPNYRYVFNPLGLLFTLKVLLGAAPTQPTAAATDQFFIGDLVLIANEYALGSSLSSDAMTDSTLAADLLPSWDLTNRDRLVYALARIDRMVNVHLVGPDPRVRKLCAQLGLDRAKLKFCGVSLEEYIFAVFALYARDQQLNGPALLRDPNIAVFDPATFLASTTFPLQAFQSFLDGASASLGTIRKRLAGTESGWDERSYGREPVRCARPGFHRRTVVIRRLFPNSVDVTDGKGHAVHVAIRTAL